MADRKYYVICEQNCKFESMTKEQILTAIMQAVNEGTIGNIDAGFVQTIKTINGKGLRFFVGKQAEYDALEDEAKRNLFAIITDDTTKEGMLAAINGLTGDTASLKKRASALEKTAKSNSDAIKGNASAITKNKNDIDALYKIANQHTTGTTPILNSEKLLDGYGYFYVYAIATDGDPAIEEMYDFGVVCYSAMNRKTRYYGAVGGSYPDISFKEMDTPTSYCLEVSMEGELRILKALGLTDVTSNFEIYTGLVAGF